MRTVAWMALLLGPALAAVAQETPLLELQGDRYYALSRLPPLLAEEMVAPRIRTGLTSSFVFRVTAAGSQGGKSHGGARLEIRYNLWDEVFHVAKLEITGEIEHETLASDRALVEWWEGLRLIVLDARAVRAAANQARVQLDLLPFSQSEELDTQRWYSESVGRAELDPDRGGVSSPSRGSSSMEHAFRLLIATSIRRRPVVSYDWTLDLPARETNR
jgi:hypothetical protein